MSITNKFSREESRITDIADEYRRNGYKVTIHPSRDELPNFLSNYRPDIIVESARESVVIEVKNHQDLSHNPQIRRIADIVWAQPGWRFELVVTNPKGSTLISSESRLPNIKELSMRLTKARRLVSSGDYEAAISIAWSAAEGLLRLIGQAENIALDRQSSSYVIKKLYSLGLVDNSSYQELSNVYKMRNSVAHGFIEPNIQPSVVLSFIETVRRILNRYRRRQTMCKCPVCGRQTASVGTLFSHLVNINDPRHEKWLESYCNSNNINLMKLLVDRTKGTKDANRPLTDALKRDFCRDR
jgi:uncharacterized protein YutE (UPF0331/DUF86 family)